MPKSTFSHEDLMSQSQKVHQDYLRSTQVLSDALKSSMSPLDEVTSEGILAYSTKKLQEFLQ